VSGSTRARKVRGYFANCAIHAGHAWGAYAPAMEIKSPSTASSASLPPDALTDGARQPRVGKLVRRSHSQGATKAAAPT
jgi:hypothetical protein